MPKVMKSMNLIGRCQATYRNARMGKELPAAHHAFVLLICRRPGLSQDELSAELCLNKSTVARALTQLEERGYVKRERNAQDRRQTLVYPTSKMLDILPEVRAVAKAWNALITAGISEEELAVFESVLRRMEAGAKATTQAMREEETT